MKMLPLLLTIATLIAIGIAAVLLWPRKERSLGERIWAAAARRRRKGL